jgi:hypothetical protein
MKDTIKIRNKQLHRVENSNGANRFGELYNLKLAPVR